MPPPQSWKALSDVSLIRVNWGRSLMSSRPALNKEALPIPKDHVIYLCDINASFLPRPGIEPGPAA